MTVTTTTAGRVVSAAGMVFAFTMASMIVSSLRVVGQLGTTIGLGLIIDTLIARSFMTPSIAAALGRWFWWPLNTFRTPGNAAPKPEPEPEATTAPLTQQTTAETH
jgi:RND superfamily putative drug exporter